MRFLQVRGKQDKKCSPRETRESVGAHEVRATISTTENDATSRYRFPLSRHRAYGLLLPEDHCSAIHAILPLSSQADSPMPRPGVSSRSPWQGGECWGTTRCQSGRAPCKKTGRFLLELRECSDTGESADFGHCSADSEIAIDRVDDRFYTTGPNLLLLRGAHHVRTG